MTPDQIDITTARIEQATAIVCLVRICLSEGGSASEPVITSALWGAETLLRQAGPVPN